MTAHEDTRELIHRREAIRRVGLMLGGISFVGGSALLTACERERPATNNQPIGDFTTQDIAFLDEVADTMLPETKTPGAKAARTGAFMALMVTDTYEPKDQQIFREGMRKLDEASTKLNGVGFMAATPQQRLALLEQLDREQKTYTDARDKARREAAPSPEEHLTDQRKEAAPGTPTAITADAPSHYFRMMKELAMLGYFTSEIGYTQAQRYVETPGRFEPATTYTVGEKAWAPHA
jgi:glucoside 3-dehydrogenase (cytochrome c) hitch-hiker subunit